MNNTTTALLTNLMPTSSTPITSWISTSSTLFLGVAAAYLYNKHYSSKISRSATSSNKSGSAISSCCGHHNKVHPDLHNHTQVFKKQILQVGGKNSEVYVAIGYSLANSILIEGNDGIVVVDTTESPGAARELLADFRAQVPSARDKPIAGIVFTHFHHDHVGGSDAYVEQADPAKGCQIWAHASTHACTQEFNALAPTAYVRAAQMYGTRLEKPSLENCGIGPFLAGAEDDQGTFLAPTHTYTGQQKISIAGVELELIHAPGETDDQTVVYLPQQSILLAADNFYESFPNLYTIRGAPNRDVLQWVRSLDVMANVGAEVMVPSHTLPVYGQQEVRTRLTNYRDAIQFVHDQTVYAMLRNEHPDEIAAKLKLPSHLAQCEYLKEYYGTVAWSSKAIYDSYMGWFSGDVTELDPLPPQERAKRLVNLAGGRDDALRKAQEAFDRADYQWALEVSSAIVRVHSSHRAARELKAKCCDELGQAHISANGRNWYLTNAALARGEIAANDIKLPQKHRKHGMATLPLESIFRMLTCRFCPSRAMEGVEKTMCFKILEEEGDDKNKTVKEGWTLTIRNCVLHVRNGVSEDGDIIIATKDSSLRSLFLKPASIVGLVASGKVAVEKGDVTTFLQFFRNIDLGV